MTISSIFLGIQFILSIVWFFYVQLLPAVRYVLLPLISWLLSLSLLKPHSLQFLVVLPITVFIRVVRNWVLGKMACFLVPIMQVRLKKKKLIKNKKNCTTIKDGPRFSVNSCILFSYYFLKNYPQNCVVFTPCFSLFLLLWVSLFYFLYCLMHVYFICISFIRYFMCIVLCVICI